MGKVHQRCRRGLEADGSGAVCRDPRHAQILRNVPLKSDPAVKPQHWSTADQNIASPHKARYGLAAGNILHIILAKRILVWGG